MQIPPIESFGRRIMICGPSNSGKSTLAVAISRALDLPVVHLDRLHHQPNTDWVPRSEKAFRQLHREAVVGEAWVMDGNYQRLFHERLPRATGIILLRSNRFASLARYFRRTLFERKRAGHLDGARDSLKWHMIYWVAIYGPRNVKGYHKILSVAGVTFLEATGMQELNRLYSAWGLTR